jgi:REP element-mobilizing transposase RayT
MNARSIEGFTRRRRRLPHWEEPGHTYFVTFCLQRPPVVDLSQEPFGQLTVAALRHFAGSRYHLLDYTVMPDHVHAILKPAAEEGQSEPLARIMQSIKSWLARRINEAAGRSGRVWQEETYDHMLRNTEDYVEKARYIYENAMRRGLVRDPADWPLWGTGPGSAELELRD